MSKGDLRCYLKQIHQLADNIRCLALDLHELFDDFGRRKFVELVDRRADSRKVASSNTTRLIAHIVRKKTLETDNFKHKKAIKQFATTHLEHGVEQASVVDLEHKSVQFERIERLHQQSATLGIGLHSCVFARNVKVALEELAVATLARLITLTFLIYLAC